MVPLVAKTISSLRSASWDVESVFHVLIEGFARLTEWDLLAFLPLMGQSEVSPTHGRFSEVDDGRVVGRRVVQGVLLVKVD